MNPIALRRTHRQTGVSLIESMIALAVASITVGVATPGINAAIERRHLEGTAAQLQTDISFARSLAVAQNRNLRLSFSTNAAGSSCYVVHSGSASDCSCASSGAPVCNATAQAFRAVRLPAGGPVQLSSNSTSIVFDAGKGTVSPTGTVRVLGRDGKAIHEVINIMGRVRSCTPAAGLPGYPRC